MKRNSLSIAASAGGSGRRLSNSFAVTSSSTSSSDAPAAVIDQGIKVLCRFRRPMQAIKNSGGRDSSGIGSSNSSNSSNSSSGDNVPLGGLIVVNDSYSIDTVANAVIVSIEENDRRQFAFDRMLSPFATQAQVFLEVEAIIDAVTLGFNGTILAYGQTSAGKSYTMDGPSLFDQELQGITSRAIEKLFAILDNLDGQRSFELTASYMEIYCEKVRDLLNPSSDNLKMREKTIGSGSSGGSSTVVIVQDLTESTCITKESMYKLIEKGKTNRMIAPTLINAESSRSHSILTLNLTIKGGGKSNCNGKLFLVDLAGSEKVSKTGASGTRLDEAKTINSSLTTLSMVINALCDNSTGQGSNAHTGLSHVPYRDSKLTYFLRDALGGNSKTVLILCCAPEKDHLPETLSTLRFGERAKRIKNKARVNEEMSVDELKSMLSRLKDENKRLKIDIEKLSTTVINGGTINSSIIDGASEAEPNLSLLVHGMDTRNSSNDLYTEHDSERRGDDGRTNTTTADSSTTIENIEGDGDKNDANSHNNITDPSNIAIGSKLSGLESEKLKSLSADDIPFDEETTVERQSNDIKGLRRHIDLLIEEVGRLHGIVGMKSDEAEEERTRVDHFKSTALGLKIENGVLQGTVKELEDKLLQQSQLGLLSPTRTNSQSIDSKAGGSTARISSIDFLQSINSKLLAIERLEVSNSTSADSDFTVKLKHEYNQHINIMMERLTAEQQAKASLADKLEEADNHISNLRARLQSAEDNISSNINSSSSSISWFSYVGRKIETAGNRNATSTSTRGTYVSPREELLAKSLADSQTRCIELESEFSSLKEAHMIVLETKDSVLRNFIRQNSIISLELDDQKSKNEGLQSQIRQLTSLLRDISLSHENDS